MRIICTNNVGVDTIDNLLSEFNNIEKRISDLNKTVVDLSREPSIDKNPNVFPDEGFFNQFNIGGVRPVNVNSFFIIFVDGNLQSKFYDNEISHFADILGKKLCVFKPDL